MFAKDEIWLGAIRELPLRDVSHSFFKLVGYKSRLNKEYSNPYSLFP